MRKAEINIVTEKCNTIYRAVNSFLLKNGYNPIITKNKSDNIEALLFADNVKKIVFSVSLETMGDMLYLLEGALFDNSYQKNILCGYWCACSVHLDNDIDINNLINQFELGFDQFISDADDFVEQDSNIEFAEMGSGIVLDDPDRAICEYAKRCKELGWGKNGF